MVNTRAKIKKTRKCLLQQTSMEDSDIQSTQSGALIGSNNDLITEILLRLPASSILRFKSISKHWQSLLSHRRFTLRYDGLSKSPGIFAVDEYVPFDVENRSTPPFRSVDFYFNSWGISIDQSCNGLLLCRSGDCDKGSQKYYVFNPTTKQFAIIPSVPGGQAARKNICFMALAFHQTACVHYKVVCILTLPFGNWFQIQIYSSATRKWKVSVESFHVDNDIFGNGVYWNGAIHWAPIYNNQHYFEMDTEQVKWLPFPPMRMMFEEVMTTYIGESRGHLHFIVNNFRERNNLRMNVYA